MYQYSFHKNEVMSALKLSEKEMEMLLLRFGMGNRERLSTEDIRLLRKCIDEENQQHAQVARENLTQLMRGRAVVVDSRTICHTSFPQLLHHMEPELVKHGNRLLISNASMRELLSKATYVGEDSERLTLLVKELAQLRQRGLVMVCGDDSEPMEHNAILKQLVDYLTCRSVLLITQSSKLARDVQERINTLESVRGHRVEVRRVNQHGYLSPYHASRESDQSHKVSPVPVYICPASRQKVTASRVRNTVTRLPDAVIPEVGGYVKSAESGRLLLKERLGRPGGEGTVYDLGDGTAAKLFHNHTRTVERREKLSEMVHMRVERSGVCWPTELLYSERGEWLGYRMDKAAGVELQSCLICPQLLGQHFPRWGKSEMIRLAISILETIIYLHDAGILIGDISPANLLVESCDKVWFIDCDSYQVGSYPCTVGTDRYTPPELLGRHYGTFLRSYGNEAFAVAVLMFLLMVPGQHPYTQRGGMSIEEGIREMQFPYPLGDLGAKKLPDGMWNHMWSHLPYNLKEMFYCTFQKGEKYSTEETRLNARSWLSIFKRYQWALDGMVEKDEQSGWIFPTRNKRHGQDDDECHEERVCRNEGCRNTFTVTVAEHRLRQKRGLAPHMYCEKCRRMHRLMREGFLVGLDEEEGS